MAGASIWLLAWAAIVAQLPSPSPVLVAISLGYVAFYTAESVYLTVRR
jgi:phosphatidylcholine synthase